MRIRRVVSSAVWFQRLCSKSCVVMWLEELVIFKVATVLVPVV